ncbi:MAG: cell wall hydrolase [Eubacteriales bacterium]|nr:cell wall hydrolase [Eubacteriales bacterium]
MKKIRPRVMLLLLVLLILGVPIRGNAQWRTQYGSRMYYDEKTESYVKSAWKKIRGRWFYFDARGRMKTGRFRVGGKYYYCRKDTGRVHKKRIGDYYYNRQGEMVAGRWVKLGKQYFYFGANGKVKKGQFRVAGQTFYCDRATGRATSLWVDRHYYGEDGVMATNCWIGESYVDEEGEIIRGEKNPKNPPTEDEIRLLAALVYLEAGNQSYYGKQCVASVVVNRMENKRFPNTLQEVIYQSGQFGPAMSGTLHMLYKSKRTIQSDCVKAAKEVLTAGSVLKGYYHFNNVSGSKKIGDHYFS